jgi:hypothetical protein
MNSPVMEEDAAEASEAPMEATRGWGGRREGRVSVEMLLERAKFLPPAAKALATEYWALGMAPEELAPLHGLSLRQLRRRIEQLRATLQDPAFILAARYAEQLPPAVGRLARAYWVEGVPIRMLAREKGQTMHSVRRRLAEARSLLLVLLRGDRDISPAVARRALMQRNRSRRPAPTRRRPRTRHTPASLTPVPAAHAPPSASPAANTPSPETD